MQLSTKEPIEAKVQRDKDYYEKNKAIIRAKQAIYYLNNKHSNNGN